MKDNGLTQKDEATFLSEYSDPNKSAQLHKFMVDNQLTTKGSDDFYNEYFSPSKKKVSTDSSAPYGQPTQPSAPSFGQKITEKIVNSASETQVPLKTGFQQEQEQKEAEKKAKIPTSKYFEVDVEEKPDEISAPKFADPIIVAKNSQKSKAIFNSVIGDKDIYKMPTPGESNEYAADITSGYLDYLELVGSSKSDTYKEKYKALKAKPKADRTDQDEKFLRQVESEAIGEFYDAKEWELGQVSNQIDELQKIAVTDEQKAQLNDLYGKYEKKRNSLLGTSAVYDQNKLQYGKIAGAEMVDEEAKLRRFKALQAGDGKMVEFFKGIGGAIVNGVLSVAQVPKVLGDLVGDTDYDWSDQMYDMVSGQKSDLDREFGAPLPQGKSMSDLPFTARLAVVGGNAIGSAALFAAGGALGGATSLGQSAATFGTAFLTSEADYYQEALDAGMSPQEAAFTGTYLAAQTALVESIIPDVRYFQPSAFRKSVMQGIMSGIGRGIPIKEAAKLSLKNTLKAIPESGIAYTKTGVKEAGEELLGQVGEDVGKQMINAVGKREYFNDTFNGEAYTDAIIGGFIAGGGLSVFSRPTPKSPVQQETMREMVDRRDMLTERGTASDKIGNKEDLKDFNEATEVFDAMSSHSAWKGMSREKQNQAFALAQQAALMKKEQERMKKLRIPDEQKDAEIKQLEDEVNAMFADQLEQQKQAIYDQENIQGLPGQVGVGQEPIQAGAIQGAGTEAPQAGGVLQAQREEIEERRREELNKGINLFNASTTKESLQKAVKDWLDVDILSPEFSTPNVRGALSTPGGFERGKEQFLEDNAYLINDVNKIINARYDAELADLETPKTQAAPTRISEINNLEQALFENEVQQNETGVGTMSEQQIADVTAKLDEMRGQNKEGGLNEMETLMKQALGENVITAADIDKMVDEGKVEVKCPPAKAKAKQGMRMGFIPGGKWDIVTEFKGNSHENGGIDIEVLGGKIGYTGKEPNLKAKKGGFWKTLKDIGLTIVDTTLGTVGNVAGIKSMQDIIDEDQYENDKFDEAGNFAGKLAGTALKVIPVTAPIAGAVGMAGGAINQIGGIDAKNYDPSKHTSKLSQAGDMISAVGTIAGMAVSAGTSAGAAKTFAAGDKLSAAQKMSMRMGGINKTLGTATKGLGMVGGGIQQQPQQFLQQTQSNPALQPPAQQTFQNPYQQPQYGMPVQQTYSNNRSQVVTINGVNYAPDQYGNLVPVN
jgi:hypothetical protein